MNLRQHTQRELERLKRCTSIPTQARVVPEVESRKLADKVAHQKAWLRARQFWQAVHEREAWRTTEEDLSMFLQEQAK